MRKCNYARQRSSPCGNRTQEPRSEISLEGTDFFTKDSTGQDTTERSTNQWLHRTIR